MSKIRVELGGYVGYFNKMEDVADFLSEIIRRNSFDDLLRELENGVEKLKDDFERLRMLRGEKLVGNKFVFKKNYGILVANEWMFFRHKLRVWGERSVEEVLKDRKSLEVVVKKIILLERKREIKMGDLVRWGGMTKGGQRLSNFMPSIAKSVYEYFAPIKKGKILDMSAGFGGRLVECMSSKYGYEYWGIDPSSEAVEGLKKIIRFLRVGDRARIIKKPFEECDRDLRDNYFDLMFSSPPYFKKELYSEEETQSWKRYGEVEKWRKGFLEKSFEIIRKKLKKGKRMIINIADIKLEGKKIELEKMCVESAKNVGFKYEGYKEMIMARLPGLNKERKLEKIFIFRK